VRIERLTLDFIRVLSVYTQQLADYSSTIRPYPITPHYSLHLYWQFYWQCYTPRPFSIVWRKCRSCVQGQKNPAKSGLRFVIEPAPPWILDCEKPELQSSRRDVPAGKA